MLYIGSLLFLLICHQVVAMTKEGINVSWWGCMLTDGDKKRRNGLKDRNLASYVRK